MIHVHVPTTPTTETGKEPASNPHDSGIVPDGLDIAQTMIAAQADAIAERDAIIEEAYTDRRALGLRATLRGLCLGLSLVAALVLLVVWVEADHE